jgi:hypothetical protein
MKKFIFVLPILLLARVFAADGGNGTVFTLDGRIGARFASAVLLDLAEMSYKSWINIVTMGAHFP